MKKYEISFSSPKMKYNLGEIIYESNDKEQAIKYFNDLDLFKVLNDDYDYCKYIPKNEDEWVSFALLEDDDETNEIIEIGSRYLEYKGKEINEDLLLEISDNEYIYWDLNKEQMINTLQERLDVSYDVVLDFVEENFDKYKEYWSE